VNLSEKEQDSVRKERDPVRQSDLYYRIMLSDVGAVGRPSGGRHEECRLGVQQGRGSDIFLPLEKGSEDEKIRPAVGGPRHGSAPRKRGGPGR
jgi:hypothetical protein